MSGFEDLGLTIAIIFAVGGALWGIANILVHKGCRDDIKFQKRVTEMYNRLDSFQKEKYKEEKRSTLRLAIGVSLSISIIFMILWVFQNSDFNFDNFMIFSLCELGAFAFFMILSYMAIDEHRQKKWLKKEQIMDEEPLMPQ